MSWFETFRRRRASKASDQMRWFRPQLERLESRCLMAITTLSIENELPFARVDEPVTSGVPIPQSSQLLNVSQLRVLDAANQPVPAQFRVLGRWGSGPDDTTRPIRWLEVHFAADVPASATATYQLDVGGSGNAPAALQATQLADAITVTTGPARFRIDRNNFDLFDTVWIDLDANTIFADEERIVLPNAENSLENGLFVRQGGTEFRSNREAPQSVVLEEAGPLRAVVRAEGFHSATNDDDLLRYVTRLTFYAGQSYVSVNHTIIEGRVQGSGNASGVENQQQTDIDQAGLRVNLQLTGNGNRVARTRGGTATIHQATLNVGAAAEVFQHRLTDVTQPMSYEVRQNGAPVPLETGQQATRAWQDLSDSKWGLAVGTRYFWQKNPQRLLAEQDGTVEIQFPSEPYTVYQAMGLGDEAVFYFHPASTSTAEMERVLEGFSKDRLLAVAPSPWMINSGAFGDLPAANLSEPFDTFEDFLTQSYTETIEYINGNHAYGLLNYLDMPVDNFNQPANPDVTDWGNSYYDPGTTWISQFARTGELTWLKDLAFPYARQFYTTAAYDTDDPTSYQSGIGGSHGAYHRDTWTSEYHYLESLWNYYYLTGDRRALERGLTAARTYATSALYTIDYDYGIGTLGPSSRIFAQKFNTMIEAWLATGDAALRTALDNQMQEFLQVRFEPEGFLVGGSEQQPDPYVTDQSWMNTHLVHAAVYKYFELTGNQQARDFLVTAPQRIAEFNRVNRYPAANDICTQNNQLFYNQISVNPDGAGGFTTSPFVIVDRSTDNCLYPGQILGLGTALARAGAVSGNNSLIAQARTLYEAALPQMPAGVWDKETSQTSLRVLAGLGIIAPPRNGPDQIGVRRGVHFFLDSNGNGQWNTYAGGDRQLAFGGVSDVPLSGDWDGNGFSEIGTYRGNQFYLDVNGNGVWNGAGPDALHTFLTAGVPVVGDWDGDGDDQIGVWQGGTYHLDLNSNGVWDGSAGGDLQYAFGLANDVPVAGDWNGDGTDEIGARRGNQFLLDANGDGISNVGDLQYAFGAVGDIPVAGDWDGDGDDDIGVLRSGTFFLDANGNGAWNGSAGGDLQQSFGNTGDRPVIGRWEPLTVATVVADTDRIGVRRTFTFFLDANGNGALNTAAGIDRRYQFGVSNDVGIAGDWNGDGFDEIGVYRGNQFYLDFNGNGVWDGVAGGDRLRTFRNVGDTPLVGDWDDDGDDDLGTWNGGLFYLDFNGNGVWGGAAAGDRRYAYGLTTDTPLAGDWNSDGADEIGVQRGNAFYLDANGNGLWNGSGAGGDRQATFGASGDKPVTGDWNGDGRDEIGVQRGNVFCLDRNGDGVWNASPGSDLQYTYGDAGDQPLHGKWRPVTSSSLLAADGPASSSSDAAPLTTDALTPILQQAIILWANSGLNSSQIQTLRSLQVGIVELPGAQLGASLGGTILIDRDAAGYGWNVDLESEIPASQSMDLLSVVLHELGHELGFHHDDDLEAMFETLAAGTRRLL